jgi:hypothetical protein
VLTLLALAVLKTIVMLLVITIATSLFPLNRVLFTFNFSANKSVVSFAFSSHQC